MRRRILLLSVGMTTLVVLAFAVPLTLLMRDAAVEEALEKAQLRAQNVAYYVGDKDHTPDDISAYIEGVARRRPRPDLGRAGRRHVARQHPARRGSTSPRGRPPAATTRQEGPAEKGVAATVRDVDGGKVTTRSTSVRFNGPAGVCIFLTTQELYDGLALQIGFLIGGSLLVLLGGLSIAGAELVSRRLARPLEETARTAERLARGEHRRPRPNHRPRRSRPGRRRPQRPRRPHRRSHRRRTRSRRRPVPPPPYAAHRTPPPGRSPPRPRTRRGTQHPGHLPRTHPHRRHPSRPPAPNAKAASRTATPSKSSAPEPPSGPHSSKTRAAASPSTSPPHQPRIRLAARRPRRRPRRPRRERRCPHPRRHRRAASPSPANA